MLLTVIPFKTALESGGIVKALVCPNSDNYSRKTIDELTDYLKEYFSAKGLAWMKCINGRRNTSYHGIRNKPPPSLKSPLGRIGEFP